jgi:decaprenyl-phosphate phosphoribosyltransferase
MGIKVFLELIRYKSYLKNLIIFLPLFLTYSSWSLINFTKLFIIYIFFCILASSVYILNDIFDIEIDKKHKKKKYRPLANGLFSIKLAIIISIIFSILSLSYFLFFTEKLIFLLTVCYLITNFLYSIYFKKLKYLDLIIVLFGFLIRIYLGSISTEIMISNFLVTQVIFFVLFILICKRREYFYSFEKNVFSKYSITELNFLSKLFLFLNLINYLIYFFSDTKFIDSSALLVSFMIYTIILIRYFVITFKNKVFDPITIYLNDKYLIVMSVVYLMNFILGFYEVY